MNRQQLINSLSNGFYTKDGKTFCNDDTLAKELVFKVHRHFDLLPNDWIYFTIHALLLEDVPDDVDSFVDIYTSDLINWSKTFQEAVNDALREGDFNTQDELIMFAQYNTLCTIRDVINEFIDANIE